MYTTIQQKLFNSDQFWVDKLMHSVRYNHSLRTLLLFLNKIFSISDVPGNVDYNSEGGCTLEAFANAGEKVMTYRVRNDPECIHIWGTTLNTEWSPINC